MGNRIHTVIGYGFEKVKFRKDPRFNEHVWSDEFYDQDFLPKMVEINDSRYNKLKEVRDEYDFDVNGFKARIECKGWYEDEKPIKSLCWSDFAQYSGYAGEAKFDPLVFVVPFNKDWKRHDDIIDYYIFSDKNGPIEKVRLITGDKGIPCGIYPYLKYYNKPTGERVKCDPYDRRRSDQQSVAEKYGFKTVKEWRENVVPEIPYEIRLFCEAANVFKNPLTIWELRAMLYTYWC